MTERPLTIAEHEEFACILRGVGGALQMIGGRYRKTGRMVVRARAFEVALNRFISGLDDDFCAHFPGQEVYVSSPYYNQGKRRTR